jgi:peptidase M48-like protein
VRAIAALLAAALTLVGASQAPARDLGSLYDEQTLQSWQSRYQTGVLRNYSQIILPQLSNEERRALAGVQFAFPLRGPDGDPFAFYATHPPPTVNLPVLSLKFFDDFSVALAWLSRKGYGLDTAYDYLAMLKYADASEFGERYPPPLEALQIPGNALADEDVANLAGKIFDSAIGFVMLHELGHIRFRHRGNGPEVPSDVSRANEEAADRFALEVMRRTESQPTGMAFLFLAFAYGTQNRGDFASAADYQRALQSATHPLTEARMQALADELRNAADDFASNEPDPVAGRKAILYIADQLSLVTQILGDTDMQQLIDRIGRTTTLAMLAPRHPGETVAPAQAVGANTGPFDGSFKGEIGLPDGSVAITTNLRSQGDRVTGEYFYGAGRGTLVGIVDKGTLYFEWTEASEHGKGALRADPDGKGFSGSWGMGDSATDGGSWTGRAAGG